MTHTLPQYPLHTRMAPTPSGYIHLGNAINFILNWLAARATSGRLRLRIDDLDSARCKTAYIKDLFDTLAFLDIDYDDGPKNYADYLKIPTQTQRLDHYRHFVQALVPHTYRCICSRTQLYQLNPHARTCKNNCRNQSHDAHLPYTLRLYTENPSFVILNDLLQSSLCIDLYQVMRDPVIVGKHGEISYQLASLIDDYTHGINCIIRGEDLLYSSALQTKLSTLIFNNVNEFKPFFIHHTLLRDEHGHKLAKSNHSQPLNEWRARGYSTRDFYAHISAYFNLKTKAYTLKDLLPQAAHILLTPLVASSPHPPWLAMRS